MCKYAAKNMPFVINYIHDQRKANTMCDKVIVEMVEC